MNDVAQALAELAQRTDDRVVQRALQALGSAITVGDISHSTGVAIGSNIRLVVNRIDLSPEAAAALANVRSVLGATLGVDPNRYRQGTCIADKARDFVGRDYVFQAMDRFFSSQPNGYLTVEGDPGMGKSAILAEYVRRTGCIAHFNVRAHGIQRADQFLESICAQLVVDCGLSYATLPPEATRDGAFLSTLLEQASAQLSPGERLVIAVDALDEVEWGDRRANILYLPTVLPKGVYLLLTRRRVDLPFRIDAPQDVVDLMEHPTENRADVELYLRRRMADPSIRAWVEKKGMTVQEGVRYLADRSESNFMYLRHVLPEIEKGTYDDAALPAGLEEYYWDHWRRMGMDVKPLPRTKLRIIYVICELPLPGSADRIARYATDERLSVDELDVIEVLDEWSEFLHEQSFPDGPRHSIYHASFHDFLRSQRTVQASKVDMDRLRGSMGRNLLDRLTGNEV